MIVSILQEIGQVSEMLRNEMTPLEDLYLEFDLDTVKMLMNVFVRHLCSWSVCDSRQNRTPSERVPLASEV
jgi:hypothetical protein